MGFHNTMGRFLKAIAFFIIIAYISFLIMGIIYNNQEKKILFNEANETSLTIAKAIDLYANNFLNIQEDQFIITVADKCNNYQIFLQKAHCVNKEIAKVYGEYQKRDALYPVDYIITNGGDCKNWAMIYRAIFIKMNISNDYVFVPKHVYNKIWDNITICKVDQVLMECFLNDKNR